MNYSSFSVLSGLLALCLTSFAGSEAAKPQLITESEAAAIVQNREEAQNARQAEFREFLKSVTAIEEHQFRKAGRQMLHRRIRAPKREPLSQVEAADSESGKASVSRNFPEQEYQHENISIAVTVYDDLYSEITWRDKELAFVLWTNIALQHLPMLNSFSEDGIRYSYFGFSDQVDSTEEKERAESAIFHNRRYEYKSRWKKAPVSFGSEPEYVVLPHEDGVDVPDELYREMDAILRYYLENKESLRIAHLNAKAMNKARTEYLRENPPEPQESVLIYSFTPSGE